MSMVMTEDWAKAKVEFNALTGEKKPRPELVKFFESHHTGLSKSLWECTKGFESLGPKLKNAAELRSRVGKFKEYADKYCKMLTVEIDNQAKKTFTAQQLSQDGLLEPVKMKTNMFKGLKMLRSKLDNYQASLLGAIEQRLGIEQKMGVIERLEKMFAQQLTIGIKRFAAASKAVKATPSVEVWNREFGDQDAARSLTTALGTYRAIEKQVNAANQKAAETGQQGDMKAMSENQKLMLAKTLKWIQVLKPWADGNKRQMAENTTPDALIHELKTVSGFVKSCAADFHIG